MSQQKAPDRSARREAPRAAVLQALREDRRADAEALLLAAVQEAEAPDADPVQLIECLKELAWLYRRLYRHDEIEAILTRLLRVQEQHLGRHHPDLVGTLQGLAWERVRSQHREEAEALYRRALAINEAPYGPDHPYVAGSLRALGVCYFFRLGGPPARSREREPFPTASLRTGRARFRAPGSPVPQPATRARAGRPAWMATWQSWQATRVFRWRAAIFWTQAGTGRPRWRWRSFRWRTW
jgi:tetratricopeptide (TPR) repeat protein